MKEKGPKRANSKRLEGSGDSNLPSYGLPDLT